MRSFIGVMSTYFGDNKWFFYSSSTRFFRNVQCIETNDPKGVLHTPRWGYLFHSSTFDE